MGWWNKLVRDRIAAKQNAKLMSEKEKLTSKGMPFVRVVNVNLDEENPGDGYFELDWNHYFIKKLQEAGYSGSSEEEIIDSWFTNLCRGIAEDVSK